MTHLGLSPTTQRIEGYPYGECVRASYATLLDLPIELVPRFDPGALRPGESQDERQRAWLSMLGLALHWVPAGQVEAVPPLGHLMTGLSPRGFGHCCVGVGGQLVWDPHPSRTGLVRLDALGFVFPRITERSA